MKTGFTIDSIKASHKIADPNTKNVLELLYPEVFKKEEPKNIMDRVKTLDDVYSIREITEPKFEDCNIEEREYMINMFRWRHIVAALNGNWTPNWNDSNEYKYYPWVTVDASESVPSGFGFSVTGYGCTDANTGVGSRLCFKSSELCMYAIKQFPEVLKAIMLH